MVAVGFEVEGIATGQRSDGRLGRKDTRLACSTLAAWRWIALPRRVQAGDHGHIRRHVCGCARWDEEACPGVVSEVSEGESDGAQKKVRCDCADVLRRGSVRALSCACCVRG